MAKKKQVKRNVKFCEIEYQETLAEVNTKSYERVRLSKVKYVDSEHSFIDLRIFQRGYDDEGREVHYPTSKGIQIKQDLFDKLTIGYFDDMLKKK